jgi:hypothetical protein
MTRDEFVAFLSAAFAHLAAHSCDGSIHFACMDWRHMGEMLEAGAANYSELKNLVVWAKDNGGMGAFYRSSTNSSSPSRMVAPPTSTVSSEDRRQDSGQGLHDATAMRDRSGVWRRGGGQGGAGSAPSSLFRETLPPFLVLRRVTGHGERSQSATGAPALSRLPVLRGRLS